jgi:hypothetical protein
MIITGVQRNRTHLIINSIYQVINASFFGHSFKQLIKNRVIKVHVQ